MKASIGVLIYRSTIFADWVYDSIKEFTPELETGEAEFFFVANDPTPQLLAHLESKGYPHYVNNNPMHTEEELFRMGIGWPEYIHRVYRGWNKCIEHAKGEVVVLLNSDNYVSPGWLAPLIEKCSEKRLICSQLVERKHPRFGVFPGAIHKEFGNTPANFQRESFLKFVENSKSNDIKFGGAYMPCAFMREQALRVGMYPEGNLHNGQRFGIITEYGDGAFFRKMAADGATHITTNESIVYHLKEGEMEE